MYLCICKSVSDHQIQQAVAHGARSFGELSASFGVGTECGKCTDAINACLQECLAAAAPSPTPATTAAPVPPAPTFAVKQPAPAHAWFAMDA